jgi:hypothetical protein
VIIYLSNARQHYNDEQNTRLHQYDWRLSWKKTGFFGLSALFVVVRYCSSVRYNWFFRSLFQQPGVVWTGRSWHRPPKSPYNRSRIDDTLAGGNPIIPARHVRLGSQCTRPRFRVCVDRWQAKSSACSVCCPQTTIIRHIEWSMVLFFYGDINLLRH